MRRSSNLVATTASKPALPATGIGCSLPTDASRDGRETCLNQPKITDHLLSICLPPNGCGKRRHCWNIRMTIRFESLPIAARRIRLRRLRLICATCLKPAASNPCRRSRGSAPGSPAGSLSSHGLGVGPISNGYAARASLPMSSALSRRSHAGQAPASNASRGDAGAARGGAA